MNKTLITLLGACLPFGLLDAKPLDLTKVSKDANWLMHMDFDAMRKSEIGSFIQSSMEKIPEAVDRMDDVKSRYGIDLNGFSYLTMSGNGEKDKGIAIMKGGLDSDKMIEFAESKGSLEESLIGKQTVYSSSKGKRPMAFTVMKKGVVVGGPDSDYVSEGILLAKGKAPSYEGHDLLKMISGRVTKPGFIMFANLAGAADDNKLDHRAKFMVDKVKAGAMAIGDQGGAIRITAVMETTGEETSSQVESMIRGGLAMVDLRKAEDKRLASVLNGHSVKREGNLIWIEVELSIEAILEHLEKEMRKSV